MTCIIRRSLVGILAATVSLTLAGIVPAAAAPGTPSERTAARVSELPQMTWVGTGRPASTTPSGEEAVVLLTPEKNTLTFEGYEAKKSLELPEIVLHSPCNTGNLCLSAEVPYKD